MTQATGARNNLHLWHQMWHRGRDWQEFFYLLQLPMQIGASPSALHFLIDVLKLSLETIAAICVLIGLVKTLQLAIAVQRR